MKKVFRPLYVSLAAIVVAAGFSGCDRRDGSDGASGVENSKVTLSLLDSFLPDYTDAYSVRLNARIEAFVKEHPNIKIDRDSSSPDVLDTKIPTLASANSLPDVFACRSLWVDGFVKSGELLSDEELFKDDESFMKGFLPGMLEGYAVSGKHYGIPWQADNNFVMYYNMDVLKSAGITDVPATLDELMRDVKTLKAREITPIALGDNSQQMSRLWFSGLTVRTAGVDYLAGLQDGKLKFTDATVKKAVGVIEELAEAGAFNSNFTSLGSMGSRALYTSGKAAMYGETLIFAQTSNTWPEKIQKATKLGFFPKLPGEDLAQGIPAPISTPWSIAFSSELSGDKLKAAEKFTEEIFGDSYSAAVMDAGGCAVRKVQEPDLTKAPSAVRMYDTELAPKLIAGGCVDAKLGSGVLTAISTNLQELILSKITADAAVANMQAAADRSSSA